MKICRFCGRPTENPEGICEYCKETLCELCGAELAKGYCAVCGRLVCDKDSLMVGFARVCRDCLERNPELRDYNNLKAFVFNLRKNQKPKKIELYARFGARPNETKYIFLGIDDFDSPYGLCTTYVMASLIDAVIIPLGAVLVDYPLLLRLNPNVPFKTRGNASIGLRLRYDGDIDSFIVKIIEYLNRLNHSWFLKTQPAIAIYLTDKYAVDKSLRRIYQQAVKSIVPKKRLIDTLKKIKFGALEIYTIEGKEARGLVGAVSAVGAELPDYTFELLAYRKRENINKHRYVDKKTVIEMDEKYFPFVFDNLDGKKILIAPAGPDPVLFGIRGEYPHVLLEAFSMIRHEDIERWCIFKTNQATNIHLSKRTPRPYESVYLDARVDVVRRHGDTVELRARMGDTRLIGYAYKLQRPLQSVLTSLVSGDYIRLGIAITRWSPREITGNIEEVIPLKLAKKTVLRNPPCPICCARLKKKSRDELYCKKCGFRIKSNYKMIIHKKRDYPKTKKRYIASPRAHRHLTMPNERIYFRFLKLTNKVRVKLLKTICGTKKPSSWSYVEIESKDPDPL